MLWLEIIGIDFEEVNGFLWMLASDIVEGAGRYVVRLTLFNQRIVFKQILKL
jgi:hypothetical protein